jgi:hypothetical protein
MNWSEIEKFINIFRDRFNEEEPPPDHLVLFETKLKQHFKETKTFNLQSLLHIAVYVGIVILCSSLFLVYYFNFKEDSSKQIMMTKTNIQLNETETYYTNQINKGIAQIKSQTLADQVQKKAILSDLNNMDKNYEQLKKELKNNPNDQRVINAVIEHYQVKLDAIDQIINSISFSQTNLKPQGHEQNM